jgi:ABC-2 type transport system permease protein
MNSLFVMLKKEWLELIRSKKALILIIIFLFVAIASPVLAKLIPTIFKQLPSTPGLTINIPDATFKDAVDQFVKNISQIAVLALIFLYAGTICDEKSKKTLELVLVKPVSRAYFVLAKFKMAGIGLLIAFAGAFLIFYGYTSTLFDGLNFANMALLTTQIFLFVYLLIAITIFFSAISGSTIMAAGGGFAGYILLATIASLIKSIKDYSPSYILDQYQTVLTVGFDKAYIAPMATTLMLIIIFVVLAIVLFQRQEIER